MKKFERAKALLSNKNSRHSYEAVLEAALDEFLKDHDPENRGERRETRQAEGRIEDKDRGAPGREETLRQPPIRAKRRTAALDRSAARGALPPGTLQHPR